MKIRKAAEINTDPGRFAFALRAIEHVKIRATIYAPIEVLLTYRVGKELPG